MEEMIDKKLLPDKYSYLNIKSDSEEEIFRIKEVRNDTEAEEWIEKLSIKSNITWRVLKTYPKSGLKNIFRKDYRCQHSTDKRATGARSSKNTNCPARLKLIIRRYIKSTKSKHPDELSKDYPTIITITGKHNHPIVCADALRYRDMAEETKSKLSDLFRRGHTPSSALYSLKIDLMCEFPENYFKIAADTRYLPTISVVSKLFQKEFENDYGHPDGPEMFDNLEDQLKNYEAISGGKVKFRKTNDGNNYFVIIITPIMIRCHQKIRQSSELVLLDASGGVDKQRHRIYTFVTPTAAGGLPLGIMITDCEKENVFTEALFCYKEMLSDIAFFSSGYPKIFLTDNDMKERNALKKIFPNSTLLLCQFHMLKSVWSWLCLNKHNINSNHRQNLYFLFKKVVYSKSEEEANTNASNLLNEAENLKYLNFSKHFQWLWSIKEDWVSCFRKDLLTRGNNTTNYVEIVFRILKDIIFHRTMAYNLTQLVDFMLTKYEMYVKQRLVDFCNGRYRNSILSNMLPQKIDLDSFLVEYNAENDAYFVTYKNTIHTVDIVRGFCSCEIGQCGKMCKHSSAVFLKLQCQNTAYNIANIETKCVMSFVADGNEVGPEWFETLKPTASLAIFPSKSIEENVESTSLNTFSDSEGESRNDFADKSNLNEQPITPEEQLEFKNLVRRIENGLTTNPTIFIPAFRKMLKNAKAFASTENGLTSAMHTFGTYTGMKSAKQKAAKNLIRRSHKHVIGVQPTAIGRRKLMLTGRKKLNIGRPTGKILPPEELRQHDYTRLGMLPNRKRKAPHNLEQCVLDNKSLGGTKKAKNA